jgi:ribosome biogenesis GTPase A
MQKSLKRGVEVVDLILWVSDIYDISSTLNNEYIRYRRRGHLDKQMGIWDADPS